MSEHTTPETLNRVDKRAIEAQAVAPVIRAVAERIGWNDAVAILQQVNEDEAFRRGRAYAAENGDGDIAELVREVATWGEGGGWSMDVLEQTDTSFVFNVTRCPYREAYRALGLEDLGVAFSCCRDEPFARGFNPRLRLARSTTIMEGGEHCDFRYFLE